MSKQCTVADCHTVTDETGIACLEACSVDEMHGGCIQIAMQADHLQEQRKGQHLLKPTGHIHTYIQAQAV